MTTELSARVKRATAQSRAVQRRYRTVARHLDATTKQMGRPKKYVGITHRSIEDVWASCEVLQHEGPLNRIQQQAVTDIRNVCYEIAIVFRYPHELTEVA